MPWTGIPGPLNYDRSELRSWNSAKALKKLLTDLSSTRNVRVLAHSMGNVVTGEAIKLAPANTVSTYIASQAAIPAHMYDNTVQPYWSGYETPNVYGYYYSADVPDVPYLVGNAAKTKQVSYFNVKDYALTGGAFGIFGWETNNSSKPDDIDDYTYKGSIDRYEQIDNGGDLFSKCLGYQIDEHGNKFCSNVGKLTFPDGNGTADNKYEIFAHCAESRSKALGAVPAPRGFNGQNDLHENFGYDDQHYSHSRQFRSNIVDEQGYWGAVMLDFGL